MKDIKTKNPDGSHAESSRYNLIDTETGAIQESNVSINSEDVIKLNYAYSLNGTTKKWVTQLNG
tara:strand:- start:233 stop:424 length:192 start_codon:yes stop_codon:yes gene_type:complete